VIQTGKFLCERLHLTVILKQVNLSNFHPCSQSQSGGWTSRTAEHSRHNRRSVIRGVGEVGMVEGIWDSRSNQSQIVSKQGYSEGHSCGRTFLVHQPDSPWLPLTSPASPQPSCLLCCQTGDNTRVQVVQTHLFTCHQQWNNSFIMPGERVDSQFWLPVSHPGQPPGVSPVHTLWDFLTQTNKKKS